MFKFLFLQLLTSIFKLFFINVYAHSNIPTRRHPVPVRHGTRCDVHGVEGTRQQRCSPDMSGSRIQMENSTLSTIGLCLGVFHGPWDGHGHLTLPLRTSYF